MGLASDTPYKCTYLKKGHMDREIEKTANTCLDVFEVRARVNIRA